MEIVVAFFSLVCCSGGGWVFWIRNKPSASRSSRLKDLETGFPSRTSKMARQRERVCLEQGLKLDLVQLARRGFIQFGANVGPRNIQWNDGMSGEVIASGVITADMSGSDFGWLQINMDNFQQCVELILMPRHFGGGQWYFVCSELNRPASVLWRPPGALFFRCRQYWGRRAAYLCQFGNPIDRAHIGRAKLKAKLCSPNLDDWRIPPKPPKMRWATYDRLIEQYLKYDAVLGGLPIQQISNA